MQKAVRILYGSQSGNAESIASALNRQCVDLGIPVNETSESLNAVKKPSTPYHETSAAIIIVCSTTGNGDPPENAEAFWRWIKLRSAPKDIFSGVPFAVLGLGDSNYDKFCHMGKALDKRLQELGGERCLDLYCADEATDMEEVVEKWKSSVVDVLQRICKASADKTIAKDAVISPLTISSSHSLDPAMQEIGVETASESVPVSSILLDGIQPLEGIAGLLGYGATIQSDLDPSLIPQDKKASSTAVFQQLLSSSELCTSYSNGQGRSQSIYSDPSSNVWTAENPFRAKISFARCLTSSRNKEIDPEEWDEKREVLHMEINLDGSGITYVPGDGLGICCPNPRHIVNAVIERLALAKKMIEADMADNKTTDADSEDLTADSLLLLPSGEVAQLGELLAWRADLVSVPKKAVVAALANYCTKPSERIALQWLSSKGATGKSLWLHFMEEQRIGLGELLALFPSCFPPLGPFLSMLLAIPMSPRIYSIASSPLLQPNTAVVAFSVVRYTCGALINRESESQEPSQIHVPTFPIRRKGLCTSHLSELLVPWITSNNANNEPNHNSNALIRVFPKPSLTFHLPGSVTPPLILIGPGTGVAPFCGFLEHRAQQQRAREKIGQKACTGVWRGCYELEEEDLPGEDGGAVGEFIRQQSLSAGPVWLFFGCQGPHDFLYKDTLMNRLNSGVLTVLETAFSRSGPEKVYVTHRIRARGRELAELLTQENGAYLYICGDGNRMAKDVHSELRELLVVHKNMNQQEAEAFLVDLKQRRRYLLDVWS